tara:strand:- start:621 stop:1919 length:1299 start_codon:yes stop_codon:yes gene_type:complete
MPYYKFSTNDVYINTLKTYPTVKFLIYSGSAYYNNTPNLAGAHSDPIRLTDAGNISLYELNIDRQYFPSSTKLIGPSGPAGTTTIDNGLIYPWVVKNGTSVGFRSTTQGAFNALNYGDIIQGSYPLTASVSKEFYLTNTRRYNTSNPSLTSGWVSHLRALKNTINSYTYVSPLISYSSSTTGRDLDSVPVGLVSVPTIFYGSKIKPGTIDLKYYYTGSLLSRAQDTERNGVLYTTSGRHTGLPIGFALYGQGILILTASYRLGSTSQTDKYYRDSNDLLVEDNPKWIYFAQFGETAGNNSAPAVRPNRGVWAPNSSFLLEMSGTQKTQTLTMFAAAPKGDLNQSSNPTFRQFSTGSFASTSQRTYRENSNIHIKNVVSSSYNDPTGSFEKTTYISRVGVYDNEKNLIGIAKLAMPVKKTVERGFVFKIKTDI